MIDATPFLPRLLGGILSRLGLGPRRAAQAFRAPTFLGATDTGAAAAVPAPALPVPPAACAAEPVEVEAEAPVTDAAAPQAPARPEPAGAPAPVHEAVVIPFVPAIRPAGEAGGPIAPGTARRAPSPLGRRVLDALRGEDPMRKAQIARAVGVGRGSAVRMVDQLVAAGWLREVEPGRFALAA